MLGAIHECFLEAFADYAVDVTSMPPEVLRARAVKNGVDYSCSVGAFDGDALAGYTLIGLDTFDGVPAAFDIMTGVRPSHRGKKLAGAMFDHALPALMERGVRRFVLEVLQQNEPAIRAYRRARFEVTREFVCLRRAATGSSEPPARQAWPVTPADRESIDLLRDNMDQVPSWEHSLSSMSRAEGLVLYGVPHEGELLGLLAWYPPLRWIMHLVVRAGARRRGIATSLIAQLIADRPGEEIKAINVEPSSAGLLACLERCGFREYTRQFEMQREI